MITRFESLERRALLSATFTFDKGVLTIRGTPGNENFYVSIGAGSMLHVIESGKSVASQPVARVKRLVFLGGDGNDNFSINGSLGPVRAHLVGGNGDDRLSGGVGDDTIDGGAGRDWLNGSDGNDRLTGGDDGDVCSGDKGNDTIDAGNGDDLCTGGEGNDLIDAGFGRDTFRGGAGIDTASYATRTKPVFVDINGMPGEPHDDGEMNEGDFVQVDIENLVGGSGDDVLTGTQAPADAPKTTPGFTDKNVLTGNGGNDTLQGMSGDDTLDGGLGKDVLAGFDGIDVADYSNRTEPLVLDLDGDADDGAKGENDRIWVDIEAIKGGRGNDRITGNEISNGIKGGGGNDTIDGGLGDDYISGGDGSDTAYYGRRRENLRITLGDGKWNDGAIGEEDKIESDIENVTGGFGHDVIIGDAKSNILRGGPGNDEVRGGAGNDRLYGDDGRDKLYGDTGNDLLYSRSTLPAQDILHGGAGTDRAQVDVLDTRTSIESLLN